MNYELAKKLNDAGFPLHNGGEFLEGNVESDETGIITTNSVYAPTLSELIEACGTSFDELIKMTHTVEPPKWVATSYSCEECGIKEMKSGRGSTPEEAVAHLWLALQEKKSPE